MGRLMHKQTPTIGLNPMPATEIIRPMRGIQVPMKIYRCYFPDCFFLQKLVQLLAMGGVAVIKSDQHLLARLPLCLQNSLHLYFICSNRFLSDDMHACIQTFDNKLVVRAIHCRHNDYIWSSFTKHLLKIQIQGTINF